MLSSISAVFWPNYYAWPIFFIAGFIPLTGLYIYNQNRAARANRAFFLLCIAIFFWMTGQAIVICAKSESLALLVYRTTTFLGVSFIATLVYYFSVTWLGLEKSKINQVRGAFLGSIFFYGLGLFGPWSFVKIQNFNWGYCPLYGPANIVFAVFFFCYFFSAFYNFIKALKTEKNRQRLAQIQLISVAFVISFFSSFDYVPKFFSYPIFPMGFLFVFAWIVIVAYAIIKYQAMDIETVIHKTLMWLATMAVALLPFLVVIYASYDLMSELGRVPAALCFSAFVTVFYFYFQRVKPALDRLFQRRLSNMRGELEKFSKDLVYLTDLRDLLQRFVRLLRRALYVKELSVFLYDEESNCYVPVIAKRIRHLKPIPKSQIFLLWLEKDAHITGLKTLRENPENAQLMNEVNEFFGSLRASILVPFVVGDKLIGFAALGKRMNLQAYKHDDIHFLTQMSVPVSIAISNSTQFEKVHEMTEELQKWNEELESRVDIRTRELRETQEQLIQAEKMATLGILAGGVAHEINNPLTAVLTNAQILKMSAKADDKESLEMIEEGAKRCQIIVQKLLNYSRTAPTETSGQKTDLNRAVKNTVAMLAYQIKQENVEIEFHSEELLMISAVQNEIEQVFTNLIVNARDAIMKKGAGGGKIQIRTFRHGQKICAEVRDNGCGMSKEVIHKIFDPFFTTKDVGEGTGLGLSVTQGIIKHCYGDINVTSEPGKGSVFTLSFPADNK